MTGRHLNASAKRPDKGRIAALASPYAEPIQTNLPPPLRDSVMVGRAMETAVKSRALTKVQTRTATKVSQKAEPLRKPVDGEGVGTSGSEAVLGSRVVSDDDLGDILVNTTPVGVDVEYHNGVAYYMYVRQCSCWHICAHCGQRTNRYRLRTFVILGYTY